MTLTAQALDQRMDALHRANEIRIARAELKRDLKARRVQLAEVINDPPDWLLTARVYEMLRSMPSVGPTKANRLLHVVGLSAATTMGGLTARQRAILAAQLQGPA